MLADDDPVNESRDFERRDEQECRRPPEHKRSEEEWATSWRNKPCEHHAGDGERTKRRLRESGNAQASGRREGPGKPSPSRCLKDIQDAANHQQRTDVGCRIVAWRDNPREENRQCRRGAIKSERCAIALCTSERMPSEGTGSGGDHKARQAI